MATDLIEKLRDLAPTPADFGPIVPIELKETEQTTFWDKEAR